MLRVNKNQSGYLLLELTVGAGLVALACCLLLPSTDAYLRFYYRQQLRQAAYQVAADIRCLQQEAMFSKKLGRIMQVNLRKADGYTIVKNLSDGNGERVDFAKLGCSNVYFTTQNLRPQFSHNGSPLATGMLELHHSRLKDCYYTIFLQPVTGRVVLNEILAK